jgi:hypothetical protein
LLLLCKHVVLAAGATRVRRYGVSGNDVLRHAGMAIADDDVLLRFEGRGVRCRCWLLHRRLGRLRLRARRRADASTRRDVLSRSIDDDVVARRLLHVRELERVRVWSRASHVRRWRLAGDDVQRGEFSSAKRLPRRNGRGHELQRGKRARRCGRSRCSGFVHIERGLRSDVSVL